MGAYIGKLLIFWMRRRSGAIHSESEEQFMMLAEQCMDKTGLFYDEKMNKDAFETHNKTESARNINPFANFDFSPEKQLQKQYLKQEVQSSAINMSYTIICDEAKIACQVLSGCQNEVNEKRPIDLVVRKKRNSRQQEVIFKYWVVEAGIMDSPLAQIYLTSSKKHFWCCELPCKIPAACEVNLSNLLEELEANEQQFCIN